MSKARQHGRDALDVVVADQANSVIRQRLQLSGNGKDGARGTAVAFGWSAACHACLRSAEADASAAGRRGWGMARVCWWRGLRVLFFLET
uniref:Uncharacterized protein n=1 Tax=Arundo donax TaxID=35708 RepID=A0A0A9RDW2_ARUDO